MIIAENTLDSIKDVIDTDSCQSAINSLVPLLAQESESIEGSVISSEPSTSCQGLEPSLESLGIRKNGYTPSKVPETSSECILNIFYYVKIELCWSLK